MIKVELKCIPAEDTQPFTEAVISVAKPKATSLKVLYRQMISPTIDFAALPNSDSAELIITFIQTRIARSKTSMQK